jgi:hypothetical protein
MAIAKDLCQGPAYARGKGIIQREITPGNVCPPFFFLILFSGFSILLHRKKFKGG